MRVWSLGGAVLALAVLIFVARGAVGFRARRRPPAHRAHVSLTPVLLPGPWWRRHRRWLTTPTTFTGTSPIVVNARTGAAYAWTFRGNRDGRGWFGVSTRWAWLHPGWSSEPWLLQHERGAAESTAAGPVHSRRVAGPAGVSDERDDGATGTHP